MPERGIIALPNPTGGPPPEDRVASDRIPAIPPRPATVTGRSVVRRRGAPVSVTRRAGTVARAGGIAGTAAGALQLLLVVVYSGVSLAVFSVPFSVAVWIVNLAYAAFPDASSLFPWRGSGLAWCR